MGAHTRRLNLQHELAEMSAEMEAIVNKADGEGRDLTPAEASQVKSLDAKFTTMKNQIEQLDKECDAAQDNVNRVVAGGTKQPQGDLYVPAPVKNGFGRFGILPVSKGELFAPPNAKLSPNLAGECLLALARGIDQHTPAEVEKFMTAQTTTPDSQGGFLVPSPVWGGLIDLARAQMIFTQAGAQYFVAESETLSLPAVESDPSFPPTSENSQITKSDIVFRNVLLTLRKLAGIVDCSNELIESGIDIAARIQQTMARAIAVAADDQLLNGSGVAPQILGLFSNTDIPATATVGVIDHTKIDAAVQAIQERNHQPSVAVMSPANAHILGLEQATTSGTWQGAPPSSEGLTYLASSSVDDDEIAVGDFSLYAIAQKAGIRLETTRFDTTSWEFDGTSFRAVVRLDGAPMDVSAFQLLQGVTQS